MEQIQITKDLLPDFREFLAQPGIEYQAIDNFTATATNITVETTKQVFHLEGEAYIAFYADTSIPTLITDVQSIPRLQAWFDKNETIAVDTETDGLHRFRKCLGVSFSNGKEFFYIPFLKWNGAELIAYHESKDQKALSNFVAKILSVSKKWIGHNIVFDAITLETAFGVDIMPNVFCDTAVLHHTCISEDPPHGLKPLSVKYIDASAADAQIDLEESVKANGGTWNKMNKDFYRGDVTILGKYAALDPYYTYKLYELWYGEIEKQQLETLWFQEALPLTKVVKELNTTGLKLLPGYFEGLRTDVSINIKNIEKEILDLIKDKVQDYEYESVLSDVKITARSELGRLLEEKGLTIETGKDFILDWYKTKKQIENIFNLDSKDDLAFLLFDILQLPVLKTTKGGKRATDKATLDKLIEEGTENEILKKIKIRNKEIKLRNTYILPILENAVNGRIYPQFNQIGTSSGRFTSSEPINFQTLPRDDLRIKSGFVADEDWLIVNADFSSLEPRCFAAVSNEPEIKRVYSENLDLYSHVHIMVSGDTSVSAKEGDVNFLKNVNKDARQAAKVYTLGFAYQMSEYKYASTMNVSVEEAKEIKDKYFKAFKNLKRYQDSCNKQIASKFYVTNLMGRKRRAKLIPLFKKLFPRVDVSNRYKVMKMYDLMQESSEYQELASRLSSKGKPIRSSKDFAYAIKNEFNNSSNFPIQSLGASVTNAACIELQDEIKANGWRAKLTLQVHDEITLIAHKDDANAVAAALKRCMEKNKVTKLIDVEMKAEPIIAVNLAESK